MIGDWERKQKLVQSISPPKLNVFIISPKVSDLFSLFLSALCEVLVK